MDRTDREVRANGYLRCCSVETARCSCARTHKGTHMHAHTHELVLFQLAN